MRRRLLIFGPDAAPPSLVFRELRDKLPNFSRLVERSLHGPLRSCDPPITVPAWMCMMTGREPGELGLYGFRQRREGSYTGVSIANSRMVRSPRVWDIIGAEGYRSFVMGVPPSYPPTPLRGWMISCMLTPGPHSSYAYPPTLKEEVRRLVGDMIFDVEFRSEDRPRVMREVFEMTRQHAKVALHMARSKPWDLFVYVEIGLDRIQHAFWKYMDRRHPRHQPHPEFGKAIPRYYMLLDEVLGALIREAGEETAIMVVSDHGAKAMKGAFAINDWLAEQGYLKLKGDVKPGTRLEDAPVDWGETIAWGWGGYYARIFINLEGREPRGCVSREEYEDVRRELARKLESIRGPGGERWRNVVLYPEEVYSRVEGSPPDLMVYFDDLSWRSAGTMGYETPYLPENDTGPDDAVHDYEGIFILRLPGGGRGEVECSIYDIAPTVLKYFGVEPPEGLKGTPLI